MKTTINRMTIAANLIDDIRDNGIDEIKARDYAIDPNGTMIFIDALHGVRSARPNDVNATILYWDRAYTAMELAMTDNEKWEVYECAARGDCA